MTAIFMVVAFREVRFAGLDRAAPSFVTSRFDVLSGHDRMTGRGGEMINCLARSGAFPDLDPLSEDPAGPVFGPTDLFLP
jgi:hypothetical protein